MHKAFWLRAWDEGRIGFHRDAVHHDLHRHQEAFLSGGPHRVLVPLCGKSLDVVWLRDQGHEVVGVEVVPKAIRELCDEQGIHGELSEISDGFVLRAERLVLVCGDFFDLHPDELGTFDRIWDRAALVAIQPERRAEYAAQEQRLLAPGGRILLNAFEYDQRAMSGPPFSVPRAEVAALYAGLRQDLVGAEDVASTLPFPGHEVFLVHTWLLDRVSSG